ncbi:MAG: cell division protein FtsQ [Sphingomonadales bacterium]|jgi:cell division protein FtsQ|nr:cell division protein FtsQ [Sphingomonadales bacterium]
MSKAISRGSQSRGKAKAPARGKGQRGRAVPPARALPEAVRRLSWWIFLGMMIALAGALLWALRIPQMIGGTMGESVGEMGFAMKQVDLKGAVHVRKLDVYNIAYDQPSTAMPLVDLEGTRQRLLRFGWVRDARVSRRLPDTLVVDIVERRPAAIWQYNQKLALIDMDGVVLEAVRLDAMPDLPLLIGPAANLHAAELARLTQAAPNLRPAMAGATWIGGRRWDLRFQSGEVLLLPEGEAAARKALTKFASMDQSVQLLGKGYVRIDMRDPRRMLIRLSSEPGSTVPEIAPEAPPAPPAAAGDVDTRLTI